MPRWVTGRKCPYRKPARRSPTAFRDPQLRDGFWGLRCPGIRGGAVLGLLQRERNVRALPGCATFRCVGRCDRRALATAPWMLRWGRPTRPKEMHLRASVAHKPNRFCDRFDCATMNSVEARESDSRHPPQRAEVCQTNGTSLSTSRIVLAVALLANRLLAVAWSSGPGVLGCHRPPRRASVPE